MSASHLEQAIRERIKRNDTREEGAYYWHQLGKGNSKSEYKGMDRARSGATKNSALS